MGQGHQRIPHVYQGKRPLCPHPLQHWACRTEPRICKHNDHCSKFCCSFLPIVKKDCETAPPLGYYLVCPWWWTVVGADLLLSTTKTSSCLSTDHSWHPRRIPKQHVLQQRWTSFCVCWYRLGFQYIQWLKNCLHVCTFCTKYNIPRYLLAIAPNYECMK